MISMNIRRGFASVTLTLIALIATGCTR